MMRGTVSRRAWRYGVLAVIAAVLIAVAVARAQATPAPPAPAAVGPAMAPQRVPFGLVLSDATPWEQRAVWWNPAWRYRIPLDVTAAGPLQDAVVSFTVDWDTVLAAVGAAGPLDPNSLRLVEYTPGGHIIPSYSPRQPGDLGCNRFDRAPVALRGSSPGLLWALVPNATAPGATRRFFLYFDTADNPKPARDYHYLSVTDTGTAVRVERTGPDTECNLRPLAVQFAKSSPATVSAVTGSGVRLLLPSLDAGGPCTGDLITAAEYAAGSTVPAADLSASFQGNAGGCGSVAGNGNFTVGLFMLNASMGAIVQGSLTLTPGADLPLGSDQTLTLAGMVTAVASSDAWSSDDSGAVRAFTGASAAFPGPGAQIGTRAGSTTALRVDDLRLPAAFAASAWQALRPDRTSVRIAARPSGGMWQAGDPLTLRFTLVWSATSLDAPTIAAVLAGAPPAGAVAIGSPAAYSEELLEAQFRYYEGKGWDYVQGVLAPRGWGLPWNITYGYETTTGRFQPAHDNDSSMGAGFLLYAASLKAAMTGEQRYYDIANAYANYFLSLEAEDVAEHGPGVAGRISYGYNGSDEPVSFGPCTAPPRAVPDCTSVDQMLTSAMGLWQYANLDPGRAALREPVRALLVRMGDYAAGGGPNLSPLDDLKNLRPMMGLGGTWGGTPSNFLPLGSNYSKWLARTTTDLNTGATANSFYIAGFMDRVHPRKDPVKLAARYQGVANDTGTATRGYYPIVRGVSFPEAWGYGEWEFPVVAMLKTVNRGLVWQTAEPQTYQRLAGGGRDAISGRMTEQASVVLWAAAEEPEGRMQVAGAPGPTYFEYARHAIHATIAVLMDDSGGIRDGALGTLGRASAVRDTVLTADFSGYYLLLMAQHRLLRGEVNNPMPANRFDYIQGVAEANGVTTILYLGDRSFLQRFAFPNNGWPVLASGVIPTPTLTYRPDGTAAEFFGTTLFLPVSLTYGEVQTGALRQVPMIIAPNVGTAPAQMQAYEPGYARLALGVAPEQQVNVRFGWIPPGTVVRLYINGAPVAETAADQIGEAGFTVGGDGTMAVLEARW